MQMPLFLKKSLALSQQLGKKLSIFVRSLSAFRIALIASIIFHLGLIIAIRFSPPERKSFQENAPPLEVVLVNQMSEEDPDDPKLLAQVSLNRGGNVREEKRMKAIAVHHPKKTKKSLKKPKDEKAELDRQERELSSKIKELQKTTQALVIENHKKTLTISRFLQDVQEQNAKKDTPPNPDIQNILEAAKNITQTEAQIAKEQELNEKKERRKSVLGSQAQSYTYSAYIQAWQQKIERIGNLNYPEEAQAKNIHGKLQLTVAIRSDGTIESVKIKRSSGQEILDNAAKNIVRIATPFARFPPEMQKEIDILEITRTWVFTKENMFDQE